MELIHPDKRDGYLYDCAIKGFDTNFWKALVGTPTTSGSANAQVLQFNAQSAASYLQHIFADIEFGITIPTAPTAGHSRQWGFISPAQLNQAAQSVPQGGIFFNITGTVFSIKVYDNNGTLVTKTLTWAGGYTNVATAFRFRWEADQIFVYINGVIVTSFAQADIQLATLIDIPRYAVPIYINNGVADNMLLAYISVRRAAAII